MENTTKTVDLGHGITKTISRRTYGNKVTDYERNGVIVRVIEFPGHMNVGRSNAEVFVYGGGGRTRTYKDISNAHAKAYEMLVEATR